MKRFYLFLFVFCGFLMTTYAQNFENPVEYNDYIIGECNKIYEKNSNYISYAVHSDNVNKVATQLRIAIKQIEKSINKVEKMPAFKGDVKFRNDALTVLKLELQIFAIDHTAAVKLKETSEESYTAMEKYFKAEELANKKLYDAYKRLDKAQEDFAKKNNIKISQEISEANQQRIETGIITAKVFKYSRTVYLSGFRVSKAKAGFLEALAQKNAVLVEKKRQELVNAAKLEVAKLDTLQKAFEDDTYKEATMGYVNYNLTKGETDYKELANLMKNINKLTQEEADRYNAIIEEMNESGNTLSDKMNETKAELLKNHVPAPEEGTDI